MNKWKLVLLVAVASVCLIGTAACGKTVKAKQYGDEWPLQVNKATVHCWTDWDRSAEPLLTIRSGDYHYPLTGYTKSYLQANRPKLMIRDISSIQILGKSISPIQQRAREVC